MFCHESCVMGHVSCAMRHLSCVSCLVSRVMNHMSRVTCTCPVHDISQGEKGDIPHAVRAVVERVADTLQRLNKAAAKLTRKPQDICKQRQPARWMLGQSPETF